MCFEKAFHLILMHFYSLFLMFWDVFSKIRLFFQKNVFLDFLLIQSVFRSIEILFKNLCEPLFGSIDRTCFSINRTLWICFFKHGSWLFQKSFFQKFSSFLSLSPIQTWLHLSVLSFLILSFARFLSPNTGKTLLPFFFVFIFSFHAFSCIFNLRILDYA